MQVLQRTGTRTAVMQSEAINSKIRHASRQDGTGVLRVVVTYGLALLLDLFLLLLVGWKEDPVFWLNSGGYPVWLRAFVLDFFYPLLIVQFFVLILSSVFQLQANRAEGPARRIFQVTVFLLWLLFGSVLTALAWNNIDNLVNSRPLHYHKTVP